MPIQSAPFAAYADGEEGDRAVLDAAKALAATIIDVWADTALRTRSRAASREAAVDRVRPAGSLIRCAV